MSNQQDDFDFDDGLAVEEARPKLESMMNWLSKRLNRSWKSLSNTRLYWSMMTIHLWNLWLKY